MTRTKVLYYHSTSTAFDFQSVQLYMRAVLFSFLSLIILMRLFFFLFKNIKQKIWKKSEAKKKKKANKWTCVHVDYLSFCFVSIYPTHKYKNHLFRCTRPTFCVLFFGLFGCVVCFLYDHTLSFHTQNWKAECDECINKCRRNVQSKMFVATFDGRNVW